MFITKVKDMQIPILLECIGCVREGVLIRHQWAFSNLSLKRTGTMHGMLKFCQDCHRLT